MSTNVPTENRKYTSNAKTSTPAVPQAHQCPPVKPAATLAFPQVAAAPSAISTSSTALLPTAVDLTMSPPSCNTAPTPLPSQGPTPSYQLLRASSSPLATHPTPAPAISTECANFIAKIAPKPFLATLRVARRIAPSLTSAISLRYATAILPRPAAMPVRSTRLAWPSALSAPAWVATFCSSNSSYNFSSSSFYKPILYSQSF